MITLATLEQATEQEVFNQVKNHLLTQNKKSVIVNIKPFRHSVDSTSCMYRGENGCKCAAGCFISDEEYTPEIEGASWQALVNKEYVPTEKHIDLITDLQRLHDIQSVSRWPEELEILAHKYNLIL